MANRTDTSYQIVWLGLQLFDGEGGGDGGAAGDGAGTASNPGVTPADAGQDTMEARLLQLGVPEDKIRKRAGKWAGKQQGAKTAPAAGTAAANTQQAAAAGEPGADPAPSGRMTWEQIMADPEYNKQMQSVVQSRLKQSKAAEDAMSKLQPAIELMARKYDLDASNMDYDKLVAAINDDDAYYEDRALEMGVSVETAKSIDRQEREAARAKAAEEQTLQQQMFRDHLVKLETQGEEMKQTFPGFDLRTELQNPAFARMTSPQVGISVRDAYYAVHHDEIQTAAMQVAAQKTAQKLSNSIQSGQRRPAEAGASTQVPSVVTFDYAHASKEQREALKKRIRDAAARGEKVYPGQYPG